MTRQQIVAAHIRAEIARRNIPHSVIAKRLGLSQTAMSRRLLGYTPIDVIELYGIADIIGMPVSDLLPETVSAA